MVYYNRLLLKNYCPDSEEIRQKCLDFLQQLERIDNPRKSRYQEIGEWPVGCTRAEIHIDGVANSSTDQRPINSQIMYSSNNAESSAAYFGHLSDAPNDPNPWITELLQGLRKKEQTRHEDQRSAAPSAPAFARFAPAANIYSVSAQTARRTTPTWSGKRRHLRHSARQRGQQSPGSNRVGQKKQTTRRRGTYVVHGDEIE